MAYEPRGHVKTILEGMQAQSPELEWKSSELADLAGIDRKAVSHTMKTAVGHGCLYSQRRGQSTVYSLTPFEEEPAEEVEPVPFNAALYLDGDLVIQGVMVNEDNSITIKRDQLAQLKKLIAWSPAA